MIGMKKVLTIAIGLLLIAGTSLGKEVGGSRRTPEQLSKVKDHVYRHFNKRDSHVITDLGLCYGNDRWTAAFQDGECTPKSTSPCVADRRECGWGHITRHFMCNDDTGEIFCKTRCYIDCPTDPVSVPCDPAHKDCGVKRKGTCSRSRGVGTYHIKYSCRGVDNIVCLLKCCCQRYPRGSGSPAPDRICNEDNMVPENLRDDLCPFTVYP